MSLAQLTSDELRQLRGAFATGRVPAPITARAIAAAGLSRFADHIETLVGLDPEIAIRIVDLLLEEREHRAAAAELVWTGPEAAVAAARDSEVVLRELLESVEHEVILGGYSFDSGKTLFEPLYTRMKDHGVRALFFLHLEKRARVEAEADSVATHCVRTFLADNWPFGDPLPTIYYDPRTVVPRSRASLHAKCVVVDERTTLITSANFTNRGQQRNIEVGVLLHDPHIAKQLAEQWRGVVRSGLVKRYTG